MKTVSLRVAVGVLAVCAMAFMVSFGGCYFMLQSQFRGMIPKRTAAVEDASKAHVEEEKVPPVLAPKTTEYLEKTAKELDTWRAEMEKKKQDLMALDQNIIQREKLMREERVALNHDREELSKTQKKIEDRLVKISDSEAANIQQTALLYSAMKAEENIKLLRPLADDQVARLMAVTKLKRNAKVLETWSRLYPDDSERLVRITERMRLVMRENEEQVVSSGANPQPPAAGP